MGILRTLLRVVMRDIVDKIVWGTFESVLGTVVKGGLSLVMGSFGFFLPAGRLGS